MTLAGLTSRCFNELHPTLNYDRLILYSSASRVSGRQSQPALLSMYPPHTINGGSTLPLFGAPPPSLASSTSPCRPIPSVLPPNEGGIPPLYAGFRPEIFAALPLIRSPVLLRSMGDLGAGRGTVLSKLTTLRWTSMFLGFCNVVLFLSGAVLLVSLPSGCSGVDRLALVVLALVAAVRIAYMVAAGRAQRATAETIVSNVLETSVDADALIRHGRRVRMRFPSLLSRSRNKKLNKESVVSTDLAKCGAILLSGPLYMQLSILYAWRN